MTPQEFKAWFEGFTESMDSKPTAAQWKRIKEKVATISDVSYWAYRPYWYASNHAVSGTAATTFLTNAVSANAIETSPTFALRSIGAEDYQSTLTADAQQNA